VICAFEKEQKMSIGTDRTELELFFNPYLGGNSPQLASSPLFFDLIINISKLKDELASVSSLTGDVISVEAREILSKSSLIESNLRVEQSRANLQGLISLLSDVARLARKGLISESPRAEQLLQNAKRVLVSLLLLAKDSDDRFLKESTLALAQSWEAAK
jgi:hypothetical protein